ncbi:hypothetical protein QTP88_013231 [Uroleucon formosanum]
MIDCDFKHTLLKNVYSISLYYLNLLLLFSENKAGYFNILSFVPSIKKHVMLSSYKKLLFHDSVVITFALHFNEIYLSVLKMAKTV